jgi:hypothetical protein
MQRCPGCRALLTGAVRTVDFGVSSPWWRAACADGYPLCPRCYVESETDDRLRERCVARALVWWTMNDLLRRFRAADISADLVV